MSDRKYDLRSDNQELKTQTASAFSPLVVDISLKQLTCVCLMYAVLPSSFHSGLNSVQAASAGIHRGGGGLSLTRALTHRKRATAQWELFRDGDNLHEY